MMSVLKKTKRARADSARQRRRGREAPPKRLREVCSDEGGTLSAWLVSGLVFWVVCFVGLSPAGPVVQEGQFARTRIVSQIDFTYVSVLDTQARAEQIRRRLPPVFRIDQERWQELGGWTETLIERLDSYAPESPGNLRWSAAETSRLLQSLPRTEALDLSPDDLALLLNLVGVEVFEESLKEGLMVLRELYEKGVFGESQAILGDAEGRLSFFNVQDASGQIVKTELLSEEEALRALRINLAALDMPRAASSALFRVLRPAVEPNLRFDEAATERLIQERLDTQEPMTRQVRAGDTLIDPLRRVSPHQVELLEAYRAALAADSLFQSGLSLLLVERAVLSLGALLGAFLYLRISRSRLLERPRSLILAGLVVLLNLSLIRALLEMGWGPLGQELPFLANLLTAMVPIALAPMVITILVGAGPAYVAAILLSLFYAMMQNNSIVILLMSALAGMVAILSCRRVQLRARVVRAGFHAGLVVALVAVLSGLRDTVPIELLGWQLIAAVGTGILTGMLVVGFLPILESVFRQTSDITLLELTDFNHPLLRRMQVEAPGSYHHSLMVANLAENAASRIGANALLCRVCSLFHDIGKMAKPEYFTENQREGANPHLARNPSMSALVIKSHVKEGVQMARQYRLPKVIIDVIRQHHGTSLIQYFYYKALEQQKKALGTETAPIESHRIEVEDVDEETYRYEGPPPQTLEAAIIMVADSVEAASRSLPKVTPQSIDDLVTSITNARVHDEQFDDTPMTFQQLAEVRESISFTLLNSLHARVSYPDEANGKGQNKARAEARPQRATEAAKPQPGAEEREAQPQPLPEAR